MQKLASMDADAVRSVDAIATLQEKMPESYAIVCIYVKQHQTLPTFNLVFDPLTLTCCFCF